MTPIDPRSFEAARNFALTIVDGARQNFEQSGQVRAFSFTLAQRNPCTHEPLTEPEVAALPLQQVLNFDRDLTRELQQLFVDRCDAVAHVFVFEAYVINLDSSKPYEDARNLPRHEAIRVQLEHKDGSIAWQIPIMRDAEGHGTLGETLELTDEKAIGRMTGYLRPRRTEVEA